MDNLPNCPFCGSGDIDAEGWLNGKGDRGPECMGCGATASSVEAWCQRHVPQPKKPFHFDRYRDGVKMAQGVRIEGMETLDQAIVRAAQLVRSDCRRGDVLVYRGGGE